MGMDAAHAGFRHQKFLTSGTQVAESMMEELLVRYSTDSDLSGPAVIKCFDLNGNALANCSGSWIFKATWSVASIPSPNPTPEIRRVSLQVEWLEGATTRFITLQT